METASSEPTYLERKGTPPPPVAGTGFRAFNATDKLPPNPMGTTTMMMDHASVKSYISSALSPDLANGKRWYCSNQHDIPSESPLRRNGQRSHIWTAPKPPDPRARVLLSREGLSDESQRRSNHSQHDDRKDV